ncbi:MULTISPECIES: hypothetical protein [Streptomyces]|uniref:Uncharacterized protein n=2 Tax=Streptomyces TaxID=1883 RepID=A0ABV9J6X7_9ACTN
MSTSRGAYRRCCCGDVREFRNAGERVLAHLDRAHPHQADQHSAYQVTGRGTVPAPRLAVYASGQEQEQALVRAWSENQPMPWPKASALVQQDEAQGERARRKLIRLGNEWRRRENNRRELQ